MNVIVGLKVRNKENLRSYGAIVRFINIVPILRFMVLLVVDRVLLIVKSNPHHNTVQNNGTQWKDYMLYWNSHHETRRSKK
jgi:hypothetical protein